MIAVIADDLTGAAELGGIGLRYGLTVEIVTNANSESKAELLIIATDTRSMPEQQATDKMTELTVELSKTKPDLIFKKVDSVLRGHVIAELKVHMQQLYLKQALLVPSNPAFGRTITHGRYFLHDQPIHLSSFADDPEFAITSSDVADMLRIDKNEIRIQTTVDKLPESGVIVGECSTDEDLKLWANKATNNILLAGGAGFFTAILEGLNLNAHVANDNKVYKVAEPALFVCGSTFSNSKKAVESVCNHGGPVSYMPLDIITSETPSESLYEQWANEVASLLKTHQKAIIAIDENTTKTVIVTPDSIKEKIAMAVKKIFQKIVIKELLIEGGATASAIIQHLGINRFFPVKEIVPGVIRMQADQMNDLLLTLKPGSYDWPSVTWRFD